MPTCWMSSLRARRARTRGLFQPQSVDRLVAEHRASVCDHGSRLWMLLNLELWQRLFIDREPLEAVESGMVLALRSC